MFVLILTLLLMILLLVAVLEERLHNVKISCETCAQDTSLWIIILFKQATLGSIMLLATFYSFIICSSVHLERPMRRDTGPGLVPSGSSSLVSELNGFVELILSPGVHCSLVNNSISGLKTNFLALYDHDLKGVTLSWTGR